MQHGETVFFPMTGYWMERLIDGRRVEVRAKTAHWMDAFDSRSALRAISSRELPRSAVAVYDSCGGDCVTADTAGVGRAGASHLFADRERS